MAAKPLVVVAGPTASGKSELAVSIAERFSGEIVNYDSLQLYRYLDIGTAKATHEERRGIPHHLLDILEPDQIFTAGDYARLARAVIQQVIARDSLPILAGGTGFYLHACLNGLFHGPGRDQSLRQRLYQRSGPRLHRILRRLDPTAASRIHANDRQKLVRALEVCIQARRPLTELFTHAEPPLSGVRILKIGLDPPRAALYQRINARCAAMFERGLLDEVRSILNKGFSPESKALEAIGYREAFLVIQGALTLADAVAQVQQNTRRYAKRQGTWFRREPDMVWLSGFGNQEQTKQQAFRLVEKHMNFIEEKD